MRHQPKVRQMQKIRLFLKYTTISILAPPPTPVPTIPEPQPKFAFPSPVSTPGGTPKANKDGKKKKGKTANKESDSSSDEERWLEKIKDPKLMTARQRAMYDRENNSERDIIPPEILMSLPTGYKEKEKVMTAEALERAQVKIAKRKQLADQKREKDRQKTMERLLKKQESKMNKVNKSKQIKPGVPKITYKSTQDQCVIIFPPEYDLKFGAAERVHGTDAEELADKDGEIKGKLCSICQAPKRYNCSKTNEPLCSFKCYQENAKMSSRKTEAGF